MRATFSLCTTTTFKSLSRHSGAGMRSWTSGSHSLTRPLSSVDMSAVTFPNSSTGLAQVRSFTPSARTRADSIAAANAQMGPTSSLASSSSTMAPPPPHPPRPPLQTPPRNPRRRYRTAAGHTLTFLLGTVSAAVGLTYLFVSQFPSDEATSRLYSPHLPAEIEVEKYIQSHPLVQNLKNNQNFRLSRPVLKIPPAMRPGNFMAGTLVGGEKIVVPPLVFSSVKNVTGEGDGDLDGRTRTTPLSPAAAGVIDTRESPASASAITPITPDGAVPDGASLFQIQYLGRALSGHPGVIHGGMLATLLDESLARCCFPALPAKVGMTARLELDYRAPCLADQVVVLQARTISVSGRKAWVEGRIFALDRPELWTAANPGAGPGPVGAARPANNGRGGGVDPDLFDEDGWLRGKVLVQAKGLFVQPKSTVALLASRVAV